MKKNKEIISIIISIFVAGCSIANQKKTEESNLRIRSVNLGVIFDYLINSEPEAKSLMERKNRLSKSVADIDSKFVNLNDDSKRELIRMERERYRVELQKVNSKADDFKSKILNEIDRALRKLAKERNFDFILNSGEGAVFAKSEYDITEDVIREIIRLKKRNSPVSR